MKRKAWSSITMALIAALLCIWCTYGTASAEHRYIEAGLSHTLHNNRHTPAWYQHHIHGDFPVGCGPTAWAVVYGYWAAFKEKNRLFDGHDIRRNCNPADSDDPQIVAVMDRVAYHTETDHGEKKKKGEKRKYGSTYVNKMHKGIRYAHEKGYRYSKAFTVTGTEFNKFDHVKRYLDADRPVILTMTAKESSGEMTGGRGITNHFVVIEKARKKQEKVRGKWRDRDVEYYVNYGWGTREPEWISVRQVGRNRGRITTASKIVLVNVSETPSDDSSCANEDACREWCKNQDECKMCSKLPGCGPGYKRINSFTGAGPNWYACSKRGSKRSDASEENRRQCEEWCNSNKPECAKCSTRRGCGRGYKHLKSWTGRGNNWHACGRRGASSRDEASENNHRACKEWCDDNKPQCIKCSKKRGCGRGFDRLKSWTGRGTNWHACGQRPSRQEASEDNRIACLQWCEGDTRCEKCSHNPGCGSGYRTLKSWTGRGRNCYACEKRQSREEASRGNQQECEEWCRNNSQCRKCSTKIGCGRGYKRMKSWTGRGRNWHACRKK